MTIAGETHRVPQPFLVMATQNPIETEGTYPLPEAQVDRFMMKVLVGYPSEEEEFVIVERVTGVAGRRRAVATTDQLAALQRECRDGLRRPVADAVRGAPGRRRRAARTATASRTSAKYITFGASPRATIHLIEGARALAFLRGRDYVLPEDVTDLAPDVLRHRLVAVVRGARRRPDARPARPRASCSRSRRPRSRSRRMSASTRRQHERLTRVLRRLEWTVIRRLDGLLHGDYRTLFRGFGLDLADLREYAVPRRRPPHRLERDRAAADAVRPRVQRGSRRHRVVPARPQPVGRLRLARRAQARASSTEFVTVLARILTRHGNRVGALFYGDSVDTVIPARSGRRQVLHILHRMLQRAASTRSRRRRTSTNSCRRAFPAMPRRSLVFVVSDFISTPRLGRSRSRSSRSATKSRRAPVRSAGDGAARSRPARRSRTPRPASSCSSTPTIAASASASRRPRRSARRRCARRSGTPASTRSSSRPTTISSTRSCASPTCASGAASSPPAAAPCCRGLPASSAMTFLWPQLLWLLRARPGRRRRVCAAAAPQAQARCAMRASR